MQCYSISSSKVNNTALTIGKKSVKSSINGVNGIRDFILFPPEELSWAQNLWVKMKILNPGSRDISQKLRQTKCLHFQYLKAKIYNYTKKAIWQNWCFGQFYHSEIEK